MRKLKLFFSLMLIIIYLQTSSGVFICAATGIPGEIVTNEVNVYPPLPGNKYISDRYEVNIFTDGVSQASYVYKDPNNDPRYPQDLALMSLENHFTTFSFSGRILVQIKLPLRTKISSVVVRPLSKKLSGSISGNIITIPLNEPANFYVEIDGEQRYPLFIFANPPEVNIPSPNDPDVIFFGPGIHEIGFSDGPMQKIATGKTIYIAGGAYVKGILKTTGEPGTTVIRGRGILSGIDIPGKHAYIGMIDVRKGTVKAEGIITVDSPQGYQGIVAAGNGSVVENVKMLAWAQESDSGVLGPDGIMINCFLKLNDDMLKPVRPGMLLKDNIVWQQMCGSAIMLGWNSTEHGINATISGLDVIGCDRGIKTSPDVTVQAIMNLKNNSGAVYSGMTFENIRIEKKAYMLFAIDIKVTDRHFINNPAFNKGLGSIDGIIFRNISVPETPVRISYFNGNGNVTPSSSGDIKNITFENFTIAGTKITEQNVDAYIMTRMGNTSNFTYK